MIRWVDGMRLQTLLEALARAITRDPRLSAAPSDTEEGRL